MVGIHHRWLCQNLSYSRMISQLRLLPRLNFAFALVANGLFRVESASYGSSYLSFRMNKSACDVLMNFNWSITCSALTTLLSFVGDLSRIKRTVCLIFFSFKIAVEATFASCRTRFRYLRVYNLGSFILFSTLAKDCSDIF